jgi:uncharacterized protein (TIGR03083 family)
MTKDEVLAHMRRERATLDALVASLSEAQLVEPELEAGWSVKDVLAHIAAWEQLCVKWIREGRCDEGPFTQESIDAFNQSIHEANRGRSPDAIREESRRSYAAIVETVEALPDDLDAAPAWAPGRPLGEIISSNSDEHYREHIEQIEAWLRGHAS